MERERVREREEWGGKGECDDEGTGERKRERGWDGRVETDRSRRRR